VASADAMQWPSALAIYFLFWALSVFLVLPFGVRTTHETGGEHVPGSAESAPHEFRAGRTALRVTVVATVLFALFMLNYSYGWVTADSVNIFNMQAAPPLR
jgi:predicted secreted protein